MSKKEFQKNEACAGKHRHEDKNKALAAASHYRNKFKDNVKPYRCRFCDGWHIGHSRF